MQAMSKCRKQKQQLQLQSQGRCLTAAVPASSSMASVSGIEVPDSQDEDGVIDTIFLNSTAAQSRCL